ncbi:hypothetical protein HMPREF1249_1387 [Jonquetella sp. BV3C21]|nr:hypothetical protein HMPREF1249_1387 [Jonquetella sp. BV3C21]
MGGAILVEDLQEIIRQAGFRDFSVLTAEVTDQYADKWGFGMTIKEWIQSTIILGRKPMEKA